VGAGYCSGTFHSWFPNVINCAPGDFPRYPGDHVRTAEQSRFLFDYACRLTIDEPASVSAVAAYYKAALPKAGYEVEGADSEGLTFLRTDQSFHGELT
jgi:hypothetical protein